MLICAIEILNIIIIITKQMHTNREPLFYCYQILAYTEQVHWKFTDMYRPA